MPHPTRSVAAPLAHPPLDLKSPWDICRWMSPFPTLNTTLARSWQGLPNFTHGLVIPGEVEGAFCNYGHIPPGTASTTSGIPELSISLPPAPSCDATAESVLCILSSHNSGAGWARSLWNKALAFLALSSISLWWMRNKELQGETPPRHDFFRLAALGKNLDVPGHWGILTSPHPPGMGRVGRGIWSCDLQLDSPPPPNKALDLTK